VRISRWARVDTRWYLAVRCVKCRLPIMFSVDHSEGVPERQLPPPGKLVLTCTVSACGHKADYTSADVMRFQKQPEVTNLNLEKK